MDCSLPGSSDHGIFQARILEWVATSFSSDLPHPGTEPRSPAVQADSFIVWDTREAPKSLQHSIIKPIILSGTLPIKLDMVYTFILFLIEKIVGHTLQLVAS